MKNLLIILSIALMYPFVLSCQQQGNKDTYAVGEDCYVKSNETKYTESFPEYGFSITAPCKLIDVSAHSRGDFLLNLGGITDEGDRAKMVVYQFIVTRVPVGYKNLSKAELSNKIDDILRQQTAHFKNSEPIKVGYEGFPGYVGYTEHNGFQQKGILFSVNNYIIAMTIMTNNDLEVKFNEFSNGFKVLRNK